MDDIFSKYGKTKEVRLAIDVSTGKCKGYGFVTMEDARDAADAAKGVNGMMVDGREMRAEISHGKGSSVSTTACRDLLRGNCTYGDKCRFSHDANASVSRDNRGYGRDRDDRGYGRDRDDRRGGDNRDDRRGGDRRDDRDRRSPSPRRGSGDRGNRDMRGDRDRSRDRR